MPGSAVFHNSYLCPVIPLVDSFGISMVSLAYEMPTTAL